MPPTRRASLSGAQQDTAPSDWTRCRRHDDARLNLPVDTHMKMLEPVFKEQNPEAEVAVIPDSVSSPEELATMVAEALRAKRCVVTVTADERIAEVCSGQSASFGEVHFAATTTIVEYSDARDNMFSVLELNGTAIG